MVSVKSCENALECSPNLSNVLCSDQEFIHSSSFKPPPVPLLPQREILCLSLLTEHLKIHIGVCASITFIPSLNHDAIINFCGVTSLESSKGTRVDLEGGAGGTPPLPEMKPSLCSFNSCLPYQ